MSESIPGLDAIITRAESTAVCYECGAHIPIKEWKQCAKMCQRCYDKDGTWDE